MIEIEQKYLEAINQDTKSEFTLQTAVKLFVRLMSLENSHYVVPVARINTQLKLSNEEIAYVLEVSEKVEEHNLFAYYIANEFEFDNPGIIEKLIINTFKHKEDNKQIKSFLQFIFTLFCLGIYQIPGKDIDVVFKDYKIWILRQLGMTEEVSPKIILPN